MIESNEGQGLERTAQEGTKKSNFRSRAFVFYPRGRQDWAFEMTCKFSTTGPYGIMVAEEPVKDY